MWGIAAVCSRQLNESNVLRVASGTFAEMNNNYHRGSKVHLA